MKEVQLQGLGVSPGSVIGKASCLGSQKIEPFRDLLGEEEVPGAAVKAVIRAVGQRQAKEVAAYVLAIESTATVSAYLTEVIGEIMAGGAENE